ncbi:ribonuclease HII [Patescibacteria group bacterium]|nr:MAG: ribonuclease HII [Patescibacteria group bacterium]
MSAPTFAVEKAWYARGARLIVGVDEAGAGAWAGPIVAAAASVPLDSRLGGIRDSKLLTAASREELLAGFAARGIRVATAEASVEEITRLGLRPANLLALKRAVEAFGEMPDAVLVDWYRIPGLAAPQEAYVRGDRRVKSIAAASIAAKVTRDRLMAEADLQYPGYGFGVHKGYGTAAHRAALAVRGACLLHRMTFAPLTPYR